MISNLIFSEDVVTVIKIKNKQTCSNFALKKIINIIIHLNLTKKEESNFKPYKDKEYKINLES